MTDIIMHGCNGVMGQMIHNLAKEDQDVRIVAGIDLKEGNGQEYPVFSSLEECTKEAQAIVDFSTAAAVDGLLEYCGKTKTPLVLCTTGLSEEQIKKVEELSKPCAVLRSANMSLGVNLLLGLVKEGAKVLGLAGFDMEIVEKHHRRKVDAPSGTAVALAEALNEAMDGAYHLVYDRSQVRRPRDEKEIGISSVRGGTIVGEHDVIFAGTDEVVTFSHQAYSRAIFAKGALAAAKFLAGKGPGLYDMSDVIGLH